MHFMKKEGCAQDDQDAVTKGAIKFETGHKTVLLCINTERLFVVIYVKNHSIFYYFEVAK